MIAAEALRADLSETSPASKEPLRMAVVSDSTPERNGVGSYYADLVEQLHGRIAHAELICPKDCAEQSRLHRYLAPPLPGDSTQKIWWPHPIKIWMRLAKIKPHAIVVPTPGPYGLMGLLAAKRMKVPLIVGFHTHYEALMSIYRTDLFGRFCRWYLTSCNKLLFRHSSLVLANSPEMVEQAKQFGAPRVELMGTSVPSAFLTSPPRPLQREATRLLFAGRLAGEKNIPLVIDVARQRPQLTVSIAGDGPMREEVVAAAAEVPNLHYLGWIPREQLQETIDDHDLLLLPSKVESFGTVALESMARGRPVIVSSACGIADWPDLHRSLFCIGDGETATEAVDRVLALPPTARQQKASLARLAAQRLNEWNLDTWIERLRASGLPDGDAA